MAAQTNRPFISAGYLALALNLQESAGDLSAGDVRSRLSDAINDAHRGTGTYGYYIDHFGDDQSGDVVYSCDGDVMRAPYEMADTPGAAKCVIDMENAEDVVPRTIYEPEADEADHYAQMEESLKTDKVYTGLPLYERFISKKERDSMDSSDFAGKGKSFPIKTAGDVMAAFHSLGRAGSGNYSTSVIRSNIIKIAKRKGFKLPKSAQDDKSDSKESASGSLNENLKLVESQSFGVDIPLSEAFTAGSKIKLIAPGKGSTAWYTEEALKLAATNKIFHAGLPMRIDHPTPAEESARPEGSVKDWGAVLANDAVWLESYIGKDGKDHGKGLYSEIKPFSDHAQTIQEKGPYAGVSIRANGSALSEAGKKVMRDGVPVLKEFVSAEGADMVTRAGAGGLFLQESAAVPQSQEVSGMTQEEAQKLIEAAVSPFRTRAVKADAGDEAAKLLKNCALPESAKQKIIEAALRNVPEKDGALDVETFRESVVSLVGIAAEAAGFGQVRGFGAPAPVIPVDPQELQRVRESETRQSEDDVKLWESFGLSPNAAKFAAQGRAS